MKLLCNIVSFAKTYDSLYSTGEEVGTVLKPKDDYVDAKVAAYRL